MPFDFASAKANLRRVVHDTLGVDSFYADNALSPVYPIRARHHVQKMDRYGDIVETGYADVVEQIERIVLIPGDTPTVEFKTNGTVTLSTLPGVEFILRLKEPSINAGEHIWQVVRS